MHVRFFTIDLLRAKRLHVLNRTCMSGWAIPPQKTLSLDFSVAAELWKARFLRKALDGKSRMMRWLEMRGNFIWRVNGSSDHLSCAACTSYQIGM
jgi:hypothetical protein